MARRKAEAKSEARKAKRLARVAKQFADLVGPEPVGAAGNGAAPPARRMASPNAPEKPDRGAASPCSRRTKGENKCAGATGKLGGDASRQCGDLKMARRDRRAAKALARGALSKHPLRFDADARGRAEAAMLAQLEATGARRDGEVTRLPKPVRSILGPRDLKRRVLFLAQDRLADVAPEGAAAPIAGPSDTP